VEGGHDHPPCHSQQPSGSSPLPPPPHPPCLPPPPVTCAAACRQPADVSSPTQRHVLPSCCLTWLAQRDRAWALSVPVRLRAVSAAAACHMPASCSSATASAFRPAEQLRGTPSRLSPMLAACADTTCARTYQHTCVCTYAHDSVQRNRRAWQSTQCSAETVIQVSLQSVVGGSTAARQGKRPQRKCVTC
jgi:hypothetical protein